MKKRLLYLAALLITSLINAQINFVEDTSNSFVPVSLGDVAFTDYDLDGDQDLLITGSSIGNTPVAILYQNDGNGIFTEVTGTPFQGVYNSSIAFADFDNDGDNELITSGLNANGFKPTRFFANNNGTFIEVPGTSFISVDQGDISVADVNNDGNKDFLLSGAGTGGGSPSATKLYGNNGSEISVTFSAVSNAIKNGCTGFSDIDNDGDQDVLLIGYNSVNGFLANLYKNDGNANFTLQAGNPFANETILFDSELAFCDVDNDGDEDVLVSYGLLTKLYKNDGTGVFSEVSGTPFFGTQKLAMKFADIDNDGDNDLLMSGAVNSNFYTNLYLNNGTGSFTLVAGLPFEGLNFPAIDIADVNGDNKKDVFITGYNGTSKISKLYLNTTTLSTQSVEQTVYNIYPNPAATTFKINTTEAIQSITLYNMQGKTVKTFDTALQSYNIQDLKAGIYFATIATSNHSVTKKLIKH